MTNTEDPSNVQFALWLVFTIALVIALVTAVATHVLHSLANPAPPDPCHDGYLKEDRWNECPHSDHRLFIEGDFAVCRCQKESNDGLLGDATQDTESP